MSKKWRSVGIMVICAVVILSVSLLGAGCAPTPTPPPTEGPPTEGPPPGPEPPVVSAWIIPHLNILTGPGTFQGLDARWAAERAAKDINAAGGCRGVPIVVEQYDTAWNPDKAVQMFAKAAEGNLAILGPGASVESIACGPTAARIGISYIGCCPSWPQTSDAAPWLVNTMAGCNYSTTAAFVEFLKLNPDVESVAIFYMPESDYYHEVGNMYSAAAEERGVEATLYEVLFATVDFKPIVTKAFASGVDGYVLQIAPEAAVQIIKDLKGRGIEPAKIVGAGAFFGDAYFDLGGEDLDGTYLCDWVNSECQGEQWLTFLQHFRDETGRRWPQHTVRMWYDGVWQIKDAIEELGITGDPAKLAEERIAIRDWLYAMDGWQGVEYTYTMTSSGGCNRPPGVLFIMDGNNPVVIASGITAPIPEGYE